MRLDQYLFDRGLAPSRERARAFIMAGLVYVNGDKADKAGAKVPPDAEVELRGKDHPYVSRGGLKLEKALRVFDVTPRGRVCMDVGASTGGFTDCMLQNGARKVYAVDVGYGQLAWSLRQDERVVVMERCNIRHLGPGRLDEKPDFFSIDVSFISLKLVLPVLAAFTPEEAQGVCLVKPQFEAGKELVGKKGVVRDPATHLAVLEQAASYANQSGFSVCGVDYSPIKGPEGNIEFLLCAEKSGNPAGLSPDQAQRVVQQASQLA